jgi:hypothetical protein
MRFLAGILGASVVSVCFGFSFFIQVKYPKRPVAIKKINQQTIRTP